MTQSVDFEAVEKAARILSEGGLVAIPTETGLTFHDAICGF